MGLFVTTNKNIELTKGEEKVLNLLKKAYAETENDVIIYVQAVLSTKRPDFIVIDSKRGIAILEVKDWSEDYIIKVNKRNVTLKDMECENPNMQVNGYKSILYSGIVSRDFDIDEEDISTVVIFANMNENIMSDEKYNELFKDKIKYLVKSDLSKFEINKLFNSNCSGLSDDDCRKIRIALFPELEIVSCEALDNQIEDIKALDYEQEEFAKRVPYGHYMVTGIPGSGKTVMLLARAIYLIKENPSWKILIITYNKSLAYKIKSKLDKMAEKFKNDINNKNINIDNIEVKHFHGETTLLTKGIRKPDGINYDSWFNDKIVEKASVNARPLYDAVLIDEYQDFYLNWIELCLKLCKIHEDRKGKQVRNIFLAGDRLQSIYNPKDVTWSSIGIDMRGRSKFLKTSYRSAKQHFNLALEFIKQDKTLKSEVDKYYVDDANDKSLYSLNNGSVEFLKGNYKIIGDKIIELKKIGYKNEDFLILANSKKSCEDIIGYMPSEIKYEMEFVKDIDLDKLGDNIIVTTYHSSKGLEAKTVFLTNMDNIYNGNDIGNQLKRKTVYVGITRASEKLFIHSQLRETENLIGELKDIMK